MTVIVSPREYSQHQRHSKFARLGRATQLNAFLAQIATKLTLTSAQVFAKISKYGAARVKAATSASQIP